MNIITNNDVFAEENRDALLKKTEAPRRRGRPRKAPLTTEPPIAQEVSLTTTSPIPSEAKTSDAELGSPVTSSQLAPVAPTNGRVFYQRPGRLQNSAKENTAIDPRTLANQIREKRSRQQAEAPKEVPIPERTQPQSQPPSHTQPSHPSINPNNGFMTARRRPDRNRMPQDSAGAFLQRDGSLQTFGGSSEPQPKGEHILKIIPLGGLEEIGKNMTVLEYGDDIVVIDMGFMFPDQEMYGVDYIIPDVTYLQDKKDKIRGAVITHGHLDHIGAIPYLIEKLGFPTMYGTPITLGMVKGRLEEFNLLGRGKLQTFEPEQDVIQLGAFKIRPFHLIHSIPGAVGLEIETPNGRIAYCTDWKFDYNPASGIQIDFRTLAAIGSRGVDLLFSDSTNAEKPGHSVSEKVVEKALSDAIGNANGRVVVAMFATNLSRIQQTINAAAQHGRKVLLLGRSMVKNVEMAVGLKAIIMPPHTLISEREASRFNDNQILVLSTGAQGEERSALQRMASGDHRVIKIKKGDTVIISASPIPGNERSVSGLMDVLYKAGAEVIYNKTLDVHTSGHAYQEDLKLMIALMRPKYFVPLHGERSKLVLHGKLAEEVGVKPEHIIVGDNGLILEMDSAGAVRPTDNHVPAGYVMVDGLGVGDVGNVVLKDRQMMAKEGFFEFISVYDTKKKQFLNSPDIISRGFIYMRENEHFIAEVRSEIKRLLIKAASVEGADMTQIKNEVRDTVSKMLYEKTEREPMVIPVIIEV